MGEGRSTWNEATHAGSLFLPEASEKHVVPIDEITTRSKCSRPEQARLAVPTKKFDQLAGETGSQNPTRSAASAGALIAALCFYKSF
jgi:hypothetical protein